MALKPPVLGIPEGQGTTEGQSRMGDRLSSWETGLGEALGWSGHRPKKGKAQV